MSDTPINPGNYQLPANNALSSDVLVLQSGLFEIDLDTQTINLVKGRETEDVYNITGFLWNQCKDGCFRFRIVNVTGTVLEIELTLENPYALQAYDIRLVYVDTYGKVVLNPDSYTDFVGVPISTIRPFTAFYKESDDRDFPVGPGAIDTETLFLDFPPGSPAYVNYVITASFPGQTEEPYEISEMSQWGELTPSGGSATIRCRVDDHQDDISNVHLYGDPLEPGMVEMFPDPLNPDYYSVVINNSLGAPVGKYIQLIQGLSPNPQGINIFNYVEIEVTPDVVTGDLVVISTYSGMLTCKPDHTDINHLGRTGYYPCISQSNNIIVYCDAYSGNLRAMDVDGSNNRLVKEGSYRYPTVTADGRTIAFYDNEAESHCFRIDNDGSNFVQISPDDGERWTYANIAGNGSRIVMLRYSSPYEIYVCDGNGSNLSKVIEPGSSSYSCLTHNGEWIYYEVPFQVRRVKWDGTNDQAVVNNSATSYFAITPDGNKVTFCQYHYENGDSGNDLHVYDLTTGIELRLTTGFRNAGSKALSVDGEWIVADGFATGGMYSIRSDGTGSLIEWGQGDYPSCHGTIGEHH